MIVVNRDLFSKILNLFSRDVGNQKNIDNPRFTSVLHSDLPNKI